MDISFSCDKCGQQIAIDEAGAGQLVDCPKCATSIVIPSPTSAKNEAKLTWKPIAPAASKPPPAAVPQTDKNNVAQLLGRAAGRNVTKIKAFLGIAVIAGGFFAYNRWEHHKAIRAFVAAGQEVIDEGKRLKSAVEAGVGYDTFVEHLASFKAKMDKLPYVSSSLPDEAQSFKEQLEKAERLYGNAQSEWRYSTAYELPSQARMALLDAGFALGEADWIFQKDV